LKLNGRHQLLVYADGVNILSGSKRAVNKNTQASVFASNEIGVEENAKKTKCMVMSQDQHAGQNHNIQIGNKSFERVEKFKYLGRPLQVKFCSWRNQVQFQIRECLLSYGAESFVF